MLVLQNGFELALEDLLLVDELLDDRVFHVGLFEKLRGLFAYRVRGVLLRSALLWSAREAHQLALVVVREV